MYRAEIGSPMTVNTDERAEPKSLGDISEQILCNPDFEAELQSLILSFKAPAKWEPEAIQTFITNLKQHVRRAEGA